MNLRVADPGDFAEPDDDIAVPVAVAGPFVELAERLGSAPPKPVMSSTRRSPSTGLR